MSELDALARSDHASFDPRLRERERRAQRDKAAAAFVESLAGVSDTTAYEFAAVIRNRSLRDEPMSDAEVMELVEVVFTRARTKE
jgi:hypothetical protein